MLPLGALVLCHVLAAGVAQSVTLADLDTILEQRLSQRFAHADACNDRLQVLQHRFDSMEQQLNSLLLQRDADVVPARKRGRALGADDPEPSGGSTPSRLRIFCACEREP